MDYKDIQVKPEETNWASAALESMVQVHPSCIKVEEESTEGVKQEYLGDSFLISGSTFCIKEEPELNLEPEETENFEIDSKRCSPDSSRLTYMTTEAGSIAFQETCLLGVTDNKLDIAADTSAHAVGSGNPRQDVLFSYIDNTLHSINNNSLKENEIHDFTCSSCKQTFQSKYNLIMHVFTHIDGVQPPAHICVMCGEVFCTIASLRNHCLVQAGISGEKCQHNTIDNKCGTLQSCDVMCADKTQLKCDINKTLFATAYNLRKHRSDIRGYSCSKSDHLKRQTVKHAGKRLLKCDVCGKSFKVSYYFKRHTLTHTGERPHKCNICGKSYTVADSLNRHLLTHTGERSHKCHVCRKAFITSDTLKKHALIHTGERPHKCDVCGKSFTERSSLKKHELTHTGEKPHKCHVCGKSFTQSGSLKKHVVKHIGTNTHIY